jgi:hypothetical protein
LSSKFQQQLLPLLLMDGQQHYCSVALTAIASAVLAFNSVLAIYSSWGDAASVAFVLVADAALLLLFLCLRELERRRAARGGAAGRIKGVVWALSTLLTAMFAARVAPLIPPVVAATVWLMAVAAVTEGFWAFFIMN